MFVAFLIIAYLISLPANYWLLKHAYVKENLTWTVADRRFAMVLSSPGFIMTIPYILLATGVFDLIFNALDKLTGSGTSGGDAEAKW